MLRAIDVSVLETCFVSTFLPLQCITGLHAPCLGFAGIGAQMNSIRTRTLLDEADVVVVKFGDKYRQWNAAFDAGYAAAKGKSLIVLHPPALGHMLKEVIEC